MRTAVERLLRQAREVRAAYPDVDAMRAVSVGPPPAEGGPAPLTAACRHLWQEVVLVREGKAEGAWVLDDEMAGVERVLAGP